MTGPALLGPVRRYERGTTADVGKWLVVFARNRAIALHPTGVVVSRLRGRAPLVGGSVADLDTTPHPVHISVTDVETRDHYFLPEVVVRLSISLDPLAPGAETQLIQLINRDATQLFGSIEACIRDDVAAQVRQAVTSVNSIDIVRRGAQAVVFPGAKVRFDSARCVELRALVGVDSQEPSWAAQVRGRAEEATAAIQGADSVTRIREVESQHAHHAAELNHRLAIVAQSNEAELDRNRLAELQVRADALGIELLALAEPAVWGQITGQRHELLKTVLEQPHLARHMRNTQLMQAIVRQLGGGATGPSPVASSPLMARRAAAVIDAADPTGMRHLTTGGDVLSTSRSSAELRQIPLVVDTWINDTWSSCGGSPQLTGAALSVTLDRLRAFVVLVAASPPVVPASFKPALIQRLGASGSDIVDIEGVLVAGSALEGAILKVVDVLANGAAVIPIIQLRQAEGRREVLIELSGEAVGAKKVYETLADPDYPGLQALENLADKQVRMRVIPPVTP